MRRFFTSPLFLTALGTKSTRYISCSSGMKMALRRRHSGKSTMIRSLLCGLVVSTLFVGSSGNSVAVEIPPILHVIAQCESHDSWIVNPRSGAFGPLQFMPLHRILARKYGLNLNVRDQYWAYGVKLYTKVGTSPWTPTRSCWGRRAMASN